MAANIIEDARELFAIWRQLGHTTAAAEASKLLGGYVVCWSEREADDIRKRFPTVQTINIQSGGHAWRGKRETALFVDNHVMIELTTQLRTYAREVARQSDVIHRQEQKIDELDESVRQLNEELRRSMVRYRAVRAELDMLWPAYTKLKIKRSKQNTRRRRRNERRQRKARQK